MKETLNLWLSKNGRIPGVLACGICYSDKSVFTQSWSPRHLLPALETAWRTVSESFQVLQLNRLPNARLRWIYEDALLYAVRRNDGICLGVFVDRTLQSFNAIALESILTEFENLKAVEG